MGVCDVQEVAQKTDVPPLVPTLCAQRSQFRQERHRTICIRRLEGVGVHRRSCNPRATLQRGARRDGEGPDASGDAGVRAQGATHPRWALDIVTKGWPLKFGTVAGAIPKGVGYEKFVHDSFDASTTWKDIEWVRPIFPGKTILKGILDSEDAKRAVQTDIDGILVSNHGGRQLDSVTSTIRALPKVIDAVQGKVPVFMDGGIRSGLDVLKALALGAKACFAGRACRRHCGRRNSMRPPLKPILGTPPRSSILAPS
jgi:isopentenyl diphosphate isomerase/L-lactate dehydrogenase-like FMN-dependent dehydrogenase